MNCILVSILFLLVIGRYNTLAIKCCATSMDYYVLNGNCWDNPDGESNQTQILQRWGATVNENYITTEDGYIILMTTAKFNKTRPTPIAIGHGQHHNSDSFITNYNKSLVYHLLKEGYEVNLINWRGSKYSRNHVYLSFSEDAYFNFDFHEMAIYDFRACLSSIYDRTSEKAIYIGYGMGSTISYVYSSLFPEESTTYLKGMISLGPFATINNIRSTLRQIVPIWPIIRPIFKIIFGNYFPRVNTFVEFFSSTPDRWFILDLVERAPVIGPDFEQIDPLYKPVQSFLFDDSIPIGIIDHFAAIGRAKSFIQKDYGTEKNMEIYGSKTPPVYDLSKIVVPVAFYLGKQDYLADPADAIYIYGNITNDNAQCGYTFIKRDKWNHGDFIWAKDMVELMVKPVMEKINQFENGICQKY